MSAKTKLALDALMDLPPHERGLVTCWFCDACHVHIGSGESHACPDGSTVYPPTDSPVGEPVEALSVLVDEIREGLRRVRSEWTSFTPDGDLVRHDLLMDARHAAAKLKKGLYDLLLRSHKEFAESKKGSP